ncbi:MAG: hypothetical protein E7479_04775 [Ruminococcaceae bacterium]|nr:hypothetical protein [Oscillospiraceae bacterium]
MAEKNSGWKQPEIKVPETELEDSFAGFFSEEEEIIASEKGKKHRKRKNGPDILAVSEEADPGFVITEVVALDTGSEIVPVKEEQEEPKEPENSEETEQEEKSETEAGEKADAAEENEPEEKDGEEVVVVDLLEEKTENKKKILFPNAKKYISKKRKHQYAATVGAVLIGLAIIGTISLCSVLVNLGIRVLDNTRQKEAFEWKIYPLLMFDPAAFEDPNQLEEVFILKTALWSNLLENRTKYDYDEQGMLLVPASDLDVAAKSLYGEGVVLKHQTISEDYDFFYLYNEETKTYSVPIMGQTASYVPEVVQISKKGNIYTLIVGYVAPTTLWNVSEDGSSESVPDKYLYYDLEKIGNGEFIIKAVRRIPAEELPEDLEVSDMQSLNATQYFDYDEIQQDYMEQEMAEGENNEAPEESSSEESSSGEESGESSSSEAE